VIEVDAEMGEAARRLDDEPLALVERFHGHLGPYVVLGYRTGRLAREHLGVTAFNLEAEVFTEPRPPMSCFLDGVQLGSGCTMGKGNITLRAEGRVEACFSTRDGRCLRVRVLPRVLERFRPHMWGDDLVRLSGELMAAPVEELFELDEG
jgi:formylmethanofuran dehydrogenase subunit E